MEHFVLKFWLLKLPSTEIFHHSGGSPGKIDLCHNTWCSTINRDTWHARHIYITGSACGHRVGAQVSGSCILSLVCVHLIPFHVAAGMFWRFICCSGGSCGPEAWQPPRGLRLCLAYGTSVSVTLSWFFLFLFFTVLLKEQEVCCAVFWIKLVDCTSIRTTF